MNVQAASTTALTQPDVQLAKREDARLRKACKDFESMLVYQMLSKMRESVQKSDIFGSGEQEQTFQEMLDHEYADSLAKSGGMGIGDILYNQVCNQVKNVAKGSAQTVDK